MTGEHIKATRIRLADFSSPAMRTFHMAWLGFFGSFFGWFSVAPLMSVVRQELGLTKEQVGWCIIGSVAATVVARIVVGRCCDTIGPRKTFAWLLLIAAIPVMGIGLSNSFSTFLGLRVATGIVGASFVVAQYHTSKMFAANCVGTANATVAGWGNLGAGFAQLVMPWIFALFLLATGSTSYSWRLSMVVAGLVCVVTGAAYYGLAYDAPRTDAPGKKPIAARGDGPCRRVRATAVADRRVWVLTIAYAACFGVELTMNNAAALYFLDYFPEMRSLPPKNALQIAGLIAGIFGLMNLFARTLGGYLGDFWGDRLGTTGRVQWLFITLFFEGISLVIFSQMQQLFGAVLSLVVFSIAVKMAQGATFAVVPFVNRQALGSVTGIVAAGGNVGAVLAGFLLKAEALTWPVAFFLLGLSAIAASIVALAIRFDAEGVAVGSEALSQTGIGPVGAS